MIECSYIAKIAGSDEEHPLWVRAEDLAQANDRAIGLLQSRFKRRSRPVPQREDIRLGKVTVEN